MNIGIIGDTHGNSAAVNYGLKLFSEEGVKNVIQVGDFGFWPGKAGENFLTDVSLALTDYDMTLYVVPGNHEDYTQIRNFMVDEDGWQSARTRIKVAPRGHRWEWAGRSFVALGGAPSVDRTWRVQGQRMKRIKLWWPEEEITEEDVDRTIEGGYADLMFAHDAPLGVPTIEKKIGPNPLGFYDEDLAYALVGRERMLRAVEGVKPQMFFHGHYHFVVRDILPQDEGHIKVFGLNADGAYGTYAILDLETLHFSLI